MNDHRALSYQGLRRLFLLVLIVISISVQATAQKVYVTKTGEKYHRSTCRYLKYSSFEMDIEEAQKRGYTPCSVCRPAAVESAETDKSNIISTPDDNTTRTSTATQCTAETKAGTRCKRTTTNGNGRCWQHQ